MSLNIFMEIEKSTLIVRLEGELDHHTSELVRQKIDFELEKGFVNNLLFNLEKLTFMDSSGLGVLLGRYKKVRQLDGKMSLCCVQTNVNKIFELSGMYKILSNYESEDEAIKSLGVA